MKNKRTRNSPFQEMTCAISTRSLIAISCSHRLTNSQSSPRYIHFLPNKHGPTTQERYARSYSKNQARNALESNPSLFSFKAKSAKRKLTVKNHGDTAAMNVRPPVKFRICTTSESSFALTICSRGWVGVRSIGQPPFHCS